MRKDFYHCSHLGQEMNNLIFDEVKNKIPHPITVKTRGEGNVLVAMNSGGDIHILNSSAMLFFNFCDGANSIGDIFLLFRREYEVEADLLKNDILDLLRDLQWKKIIYLS
ncbi:PqqD family protein [Edwardsiella tarda]